jgi:Tryptophanyl-tRNA synthetase
LTFFLEDDEKLKKIHDEYSKGTMLTGQIKQELINVLVPLILNHQKARDKITDDVVRSFMTIRKLGILKK